MNTILSLGLLALALLPEGGESALLAVPSSEKARGDMILVGVQGEGGRFYHGCLREPRS